MTKKQLFITILVAFFVGAIGSLLLGHFALPYLSNFRGLSWLSKLTTTSPIVINRSEQIQLNEGVNLIDLIKTSGNFTVSIYGTKDNFLGNGLIVTSDGLILVPQNIIGAQTQLSVVINDGKKFPATVKSKDSKNGLAILGISAQGLPIAQFDDAKDLEPGHRVIYLGRGNAKFEREAIPGFVTQSLANQLGAKQISSDAVLTPDYFGGPIFNLSGHVVGLVVNGTQNIISEDLKPALSEYLSTTK